MRRRFMNISHINIDNYLTIEALEDGLTVSLSGNVFEYCIDGDGHWKKVIDAETESIDTGHMLSIRGEARYISQTLGVGTFKISKKCNLKGNCLSILFKDNAANNYSLESGKHSLARLFERCESIVEVSENFLPATTLTDGCYAYMFYLCESLVKAPALPATTLAINCYMYMYKGCSKLNYIKMLATNISATNCLSGWVYGVSSTGTFVKNPAMTTLPTGLDGIPSGWTVVNDGEESGGNLITFTIEGNEYQAEEGMTWFDWCNDTYYSKGEWVVGGNLVYDKEHTMSIRAYAYDTIVSGQNYMLMAVGSGGVI